MKVLSVELPREMASVELIDLADFHIGDKMADWALIQSLISGVRDTPNRYCILGGDLMDTAIASSIGDTYGANLQPMEQLKTCVKLFEPIKDKILCVLHGNHEKRAYKSDGIDMTAMMCAQLGIADKYSDTSALLFIRFGTNTMEGKDKRQCYTVYCTHGSGSGRKAGGKINRLADYASIVDCDVYMVGHTHFPATFKEGFYRMNMGNSSYAYVTHTFVNTAAALNYGGYGDTQGYKPSSKDYPVTVLDGRRKNVIVRL